MTKDQIGFSTVKLRVENDRGYALGTGVIYSINIGGRKKFYVLTNKHVLKEGKSVSMKFFLRPDDGKVNPSNFFSYELTRMSQVLMHPKPNVDLCAIPINAAFISAKKNNLKLHIASFSSIDLPDKNCIKALSAVENVLMAGYAAGEIDINYVVPPMVTKGTTATDPKVDYIDKKEFVVDVNGDNGSSGSPIILLRNDWVSEEGKLTLYEDILLLGIVFAGYDYHRQYIIEKGGDVIPITYATSSGLMVAIKAERIRELEKLIIKKSVKIVC